MKSLNRNNTFSSSSATSFPAHQLSNGLYVSGRPDQYREKGQKMTSTVMPYTGGDIKKSGELGKMFDIPVETSGSLKSRKSVQAPNGSSNRSYLIRSTSGPLPTGAPRLLSASHSVNNKQCVAPQGSSPGPTADFIVNLPKTGLITSAGIILQPSGSRKGFSGSLDMNAVEKLMQGGPIPSSLAVNDLSLVEDSSFRKRALRIALCAIIPLFVIGFIAGGFVLATVQSPIVLVLMGSLFMAMLLLFAWNTCWQRTSALSSLEKFGDKLLDHVKDGQYVKVTGVVNCGSVALESSYQNVNRCIYTSTGLHEYRDLNSKAATKGHRYCTWGLTHLERHVVDFYISDVKSGFRALVKTGFSARVSPNVKESTIVDIAPDNKELPVNFQRWLAERKLHRSQRRMKLTEGYIREGSKVSVWGVLQRHENVVMIVAPPEPVSTGCQWAKFLLPAHVDGLIIRSEETLKADGIPL